MILFSIYGEKYHVRKYNPFALRILYENELFLQDVIGLLHILHPIRDKFSFYATFDSPFFTTQISVTKFKTEFPEKSPNEA